MFRRFLRCAILLLGLLSLGTGPALAGTIVVKLGTLVPEGSVWHDALLQVRQEWHDLTDGQVELRIYAGGVLGGEDEMVRKLQRRGLDAVAITSSGLPHIDGSVNVLNIPLLFESYDELEYVRSRVAPELERHIGARNFKVLTWFDTGWIYFFTKSPVRTPEDLRALRLWMSSGSPEDERLFKEFGFNVVPLPVTDMLTALQTGLLEAIVVPPLFALLDRSYQAAPYMTDVRWAPLNAAMVISTRAWARIPARYHAALLASVRDIARETQVEIRRAGVEAVEEMQARGLTVIELKSATREAWRREARAAYPVLREASSHPSLFDEVLRLSEEYRLAQMGSAAAERLRP